MMASGDADIEAVMSFERDLSDCGKQQDAVHATFDTPCVRRLVRAQPHGARLIVQVYSEAAKDDPSRLQAAMFVASIYNVEFGDQSLAELVVDRAEALGAMKYIDALAYGDEGKRGRGLRSFLRGRRSR